MRLRERILRPFDRFQRILFFCFFALALLIDSGLMLYYEASFSPTLTHFGQVFALILIATNTSSTRIVISGFLLLLLFNLFFLEKTHYDTYFITRSFYFGKALNLFGMRVHMNFFSHVGLYAVFTYLGFHNPFGVRIKKESELIDNFK